MDEGTSHMTSPEDQGPSQGSSLSVRVECPVRDQWLAHTDLGTLTLQNFGQGILVRDLDLARLLGFGRDRDIRQLIGRMMRATDRRAARFKHVHQGTVFQQQGTRHGGIRTFRVQEYWLTRAQALLVASQSKLPRAWEVTEAVVESFHALLLPAPAPAIVLPDPLETIAAELQQQRDQMAQCLERMSLLEQALQARSTPHVAIGRDSAREILNRIGWAADVGVPRQRSLRAWSGIRKHFEGLVRKAAGWSPTGRLEDQPSAGEAAARVRLRELEEQVQKSVLKPRPHPAKTAPKTRASLQLVPK